GEEGVQVGGGLPGVEGTPDGTRREPVHGRPALGLHVRQHVEHVGERPLQRARRDRRQVGLEQHVVQRFRQQRRQQPGGGGRGRGLLGGGEGGRDRRRGGPVVHRQLVAGAPVRRVRPFPVAGPGRSRRGAEQGAAVRGQR